MLFDERTQKQPTLDVKDAVQALQSAVLEGREKVQQQEQVLEKASHNQQSEDHQKGQENKQEGEEQGGSQGDKNASKQKGKHLDQEEQSRKDASLAVEQQESAIEEGHGTASEGVSSGTKQPEPGKIDEQEAAKWHEAGRQRAMAEQKKADETKRDEAQQKEEAPQGTGSGDTNEERQKEKRAEWQNEVAGGKDKASTEDETKVSASKDEQSAQQTEEKEATLQGSEVAMQLQEDKPKGQPGVRTQEASEQAEGESESWERTSGALQRGWSGGGAKSSEEKGFDKENWARKGKGKIEEEYPDEWHRTEQLMDEKWMSAEPQSAANQVAAMAEKAQSLQVSEVGRSLATAVGVVRDAAMGWKERLEDPYKKDDDTVHVTTAHVAQGLKGLGDGVDNALEQASIGTISAVKTTAGAVAGLQERAGDALRGREKGETAATDKGAAEKEAGIKTQEMSEV